MAITITPVPVSVEGLMRVTVSGGVTTGWVWQQDTSGNKFVISGGEQVDLSGTVVIDDYEAAQDEALTYVTTSDAAGSVVTATSAPTVLPSEGRCWLKHPGQPSLNMQVTLEGMRLGRDLPTSVTRIIGRRTPIVRSAQRWSGEGAAVVRTMTWEQSDGMWSLLDSGQVLLIQTPGDMGLGSYYVSVGRVEPESMVQDGLPEQRWEMPITETDRPVGTAVSLSGKHWDDVMAAWNTYLGRTATWDDVLDAFPGKTWWQFMVDPSPPA